MGVGQQASIFYSKQIVPFLFQEEASKFCYCTYFY